MTQYEQITYSVEDPVAIHPPTSIFGLKEGCCQIQTRSNFREYSMSGRSTSSTVDRTVR